MAKGKIVKERVFASESKEAMLLIEAMGVKCEGLRMFKLIMEVGKPAMIECEYFARWENSRVGKCIAVMKSWFKRKGAKA